MPLMKTTLAKINRGPQSWRRIDPCESAHLYCLFARNTFFCSARLVPAVGPVIPFAPERKAEGSLEFDEIKLKVFDENEQS
jgi:hypothetical protein